MTNFGQKNKVLFIVTQSELGGAQRYILDLAQIFNDTFEVLAAAGGNGGLFDELTLNNIKFSKLKNLVREINLVKDIKAAWEIYKLIKKERPDILHVNSSKAGILGALAGRLAGVKKIVYTVHGFVFNEPMPAWQKTFYIWAEKISAWFKDYLICVSEFDRQCGLKFKIAPAKKLITIHNGIDRINFLSQAEARQTLNKTYSLQLTAYSLIGTIANFYPTKGLTYLIQAAEIIVKKYPACHFIIIGDGDGRQDLETEIEKNNLKNNFHLIGAIREARKFLKAFDVYVCASIKEGFPYSILEAMAAPLPIISTDAGGIPEMIEYNKSGLLISPANPQMLAEAILKLLTDDNQAKKLAAEAANIVKNKFNLEKMAKKTAKLYEN